MTKDAALLAEVTSMVACNEFREETRMKSTHLAAGVATVAVLLTLGSSAPSFAMGCAATFDAVGRARNGGAGEQIATRIAILDWQSQVHKAFGTHCSDHWSNAQNKSVDCQAGMGHIECKVEADPGPR
jgi:hypothetical protein